MFGPKIYYGADVSGGSGVETRVAGFDLGNDRHYTLEEVDANGNVVTDSEHRDQRVFLRDLGERGIEVMRGVNYEPKAAPGETLTVRVGTHSVGVKGTATRGVTLNGEKATLVRK